MPAIGDGPLSDLFTNERYVKMKHKQTETLFS